MKLFIASALCMALIPLAGAQANHAKPAQDKAQISRAGAKLIDPSQATLEFKSVGDGLPVSAQDVFIGYPLCGEDGALYFNAVVLPKGEWQIISVSPKNQVNSYGLTAATGLVDVSPPLAMDARDSAVYVMVTGARSDVLRDHDVKPHSTEMRDYSKYFIVRFKSAASAPEAIPLDLPFQPSRFAVMDEDNFIVLGLERANQTPVLALVDGSGELERYIDAYPDFGSGDSIVANAPQSLKSGFAKLPEGAPLQSALSAAQFVHYHNSLLLLLPGKNAKVFTIRNGGAIESTALRLPAGLQAESILPSDNNWFIRAADTAATGNLVLVMVDPSTGKALRILHSPQVGARLILCVHDGDYFGIHWAGKNENEKLFRMKTAQ